jgi:outer membrane receptor protein involved in Fe transport
MKNLNRDIWLCFILAATLAALPRRLPAASEEPESKLEEIIVTAQRREQKLQDVPISVSAFNAETLENKGINRLDDLDKADPSLVFNTNSGTQRPMIRGIASGGIVPGNEGAASVYIDDVYYAHFLGIFMDINNIDRVEVLKGPQGTLFGRNSVAGLIHVITRDPDPKDTVVDATLGYANYETLSGQLYASERVLSAERLGKERMFTVSGGGDRYLPGQAHQLPLEAGRHSDRHDQNHCDWLLRQLDRHHSNPQRTISRCARLLRHSAHIWPATGHRSRGRIL